MNKRLLPLGLVMLVAACSDVDQGDFAPPLLVTVTHDAAEPFRFDRRLDE